MTQPALPSPDPRYEVERVLGSGSFGQVLLARDRELGRAVALKLLTPRRGSAALEERFRREAQVTAELRHEHVVQVYDHGVSETGAAFIVYEFVAGKDLSTLRDEGAVLPADALTWARQVADALRVCHAQGILHRDLKPGNILIREDGRAVLCDFGLAKGADHSQALTRTGAVVGTPYFMAPELWLGGEQDAASDQFAWAATFYEVTYGVRVWEVTGLDPLRQAGELKDWVAQAPPGRDDVPKELRTTLLRALRSIPQDRFGCMGEVLDALEPGAASDAYQSLGGSDASLPLELETLSRSADIPEFAGPSTPAGGVSAALRATTGAFGSASAARPFLLGGVLLAGALGILIHLGRPAPPAPRPEPPTALVPARPDPAGDAAARLGEARAALEEAARALVDPHRLGSGVLPSVDEDHIRETRAALLDPAAPERFDRFFQRLRTWLRLALPAGGPPRAREDLALLARLGREVGGHLMEDYARLHAAKELIDVGVGLRQEGEAPWQLFTQAEPLLNELETLVGLLAEDLAPSFEAAPLDLLELQVGLTTGIARAEAPALHRVVVARLRAAATPLEATRLLELHERLHWVVVEDASSMFNILAESSFSAKRIGDFLDADRDLLVDREVLLDAEQRSRVADVTARGALRIARAHPDLVGARLRPLVRAMLEEIEVRMASRPARRAALLRGWREGRVGEGLERLPVLRARVHALVGE